MAENRARPINRRQAIRTALAAVFGATVGAAVGGSSGGVDSSQFVRLRPTVAQRLRSENSEIVALEVESQGAGSADAIRGFTHAGILTFNVNPELGIIAAQALQLINPVPPGNSFSFAVAEDSPVSPGSGRVVFGTGIDDRWADYPGFGGGPVLDGGTATPISFTPVLGVDVPGLLLQNLRGLSTDDIMVQSNLKAGGQVGLTTSSVGTAASGFCGPTHRHAFSGRFLDSSNTLPVALGPAGPFPLNMGLRLNQFNWTLRRVSVFTFTPATGGTETYGVVNAAGALQGTAVVLPAGANFVAGAAQVTNLVSLTNYFFAQIASGAATPSANTKVYTEYTMNA